MTLKIKRLSEKAVMPTRAHATDAGLDLIVTEITQELNEGGELILVYHTGIAIQMEDGYVGFIFPRSSIAKKTITPTNCVGTVDAGYRGEITWKMRSTVNTVPAVYKPGDKFAQLVFVKLPDVEIIEASELDESDRGTGSYGSSDSMSAVSDTQSLPESEGELINSEPQQAAGEESPEQA